jgi:hypothetical protein
MAAIIISALISLMAWIEASAAAQQFDCVLTDTSGQLASENRAIVVAFDESAKTSEGAVRQSELQFQQRVDQQHSHKRASASTDRHSASCGSNTRQTRLSPNLDIAGEWRLATDR